MNLNSNDHTRTLINVLKVLEQDLMQHHKRGKVLDEPLLDYPNLAWLSCHCLLINETKLHNDNVARVEAAGFFVTRNKEGLSFHSKYGRVNIPYQPADRSIGEHISNDVNRVVSGLTKYDSKGL